jgi:hypothetical protein
MAILEWPSLAEGNESPSLRVDDERPVAPFLADQYWRSRTASVST